VSLSTRDPIGDAQSNVLGTLRVLEAARSCGVGKVVYASSGGTLYGDPRSLPCAESDPITPMSPYGTSKFLAEQYLMLYQRLHGLNCTVLRFGNVYGPRQDPHGEAGVVAIFAQAMLEGRETRIFGDGSQERDFVYVDDVVEAFISAIDRGHGEAFNIGSGRGTSVNRIYQLLRGLTGSSREASYCPARPGDVHKIYLECSKARDQLGWTAQTPLEEGLRRTVEYFRRARQGTAQA
jgi:UDP-glucose 4-epimerase